MQTDDTHRRHPGKADSLDPEWVSDNEVIPFLRWSARVLGVLLAGFFLFMFIGESIENRDHYPSMDTMTLVRVTPAFAYVVGMFLALKWERAGAILGGASLAIVAIIVAFFVPHDRGALSAIGASIAAFAFSLPVILYAVCRALEERDRKRHRAPT
jgi:hypothetical protein